MKIVILGAGESGVGAAILAKQKGHDVFVSDSGVISDKYEAILSERGIPYEGGQHTETEIFTADEVIKSPGIPEKVQIVRSLESKGIPIISEIEFAARYTNARLIGITGSNGKTTTSTLTHHLLKTAGYNAGLAGNVGPGFAWHVAEDPRDLYVLELSSFQLDGIQEFRADIALLLNITPDHLDRYEYRMENYIRSKFRIIRNQKPSDIFIYKADDPNIRGHLMEETPVARLLPIRETMVKGSLIQFGKTEIDLNETQLRGIHNGLNALFAIAVAKELGADETAIREGLRTFVPVPHRMEKVATINGVEYINDSKATNVDAVYYALESMEKPIIWIVGGQDKGNDYSPLKRLVEKKVKTMICLGKDNQKILEFFAGTQAEKLETRSAGEAVREATKKAKPGDVVLLSPACASFDLFKNYEDRGNQFKEEVMKQLL